MMSNEGYRDRILTCRDCSNDFTFTVGEQEFYAGKGLTNTPSRCPSCRALRRGGQSNSGSRAPRRDDSNSYGGGSYGGGSSGGYGGGSRGRDRDRRDGGRDRRDSRW